MKNFLLKLMNLFKKLNPFKKKSRAMNVAKYLEECNKENLIGYEVVLEPEAYTEDKDTFQWDDDDYNKYSEDVENNVFKKVNKSKKTKNSKKPKRTNKAKKTTKRGKNAR